MFATGSFPLPTIWCTDLPWFFLAIHAPIVADGCVTLRCGAKVIQLDCEDGAVRWATEVDPEGGNGALFLSHQGQFLTEQARQPPDCLGTILALDAAGKERWRTDLPTMVALGSATVVDKRILVLNLESGQLTTTLYGLDLDNGDLPIEVTLPWPAATMVAAGGGLVARSPTPTADTPGLYRMGADGRDLTPVLNDPVLYLERNDDLLLVVSRANTRETPVVRVYHAESLAPVWSSLSHTGAAALASGTVFHVEASSDPNAQASGVLVARDAQTGHVHWRSGPLPGKILSIAVDGPVIICNHRKGQALYWRASGDLIGAARGSYGPPIAVGKRLYICRPRAMLCAALDGLDA